MNETHSYRRFAVSDRIEHWLLTISFGLLAITGLVQRYPDSDLAIWAISALGGIETVRLLHHLAALVLMLETIYHLGIVGYKVFVLRTPMTMLPGSVDVRNGLQALRYNVGLSKDRALQGRYSFEEKMEYWAVAWGTIVMGLTGFMLWNPIATTRILPGDLIPAAKMAHGLEAILAVAAIFIWHLYHVHIRHLNKSMFNGYLNEEEMSDEHPQELAVIQAGKRYHRPAPEVVAGRRRIFFPVYGALTVIMLAGVWFFVGFEQTAITTVPPAEDVVVYVPLTPTPLPTVPPSPTPRPTNTPGPEQTPAAGPLVAWKTGIGDLMQARCASCHSSATALGNLDLSSYQAAMAGGASGPAIVPGETQTSLLITRQASGNHPGQFTADELEQVIHWIEIGAPEQ